MFWRGVFGYLPGNIVQAAVGFGSIVVFTRLLSPADYGQYALALSVAAIIHLVSFTWLEAAVARFYAAATSAQDRADLFATIYRAFAVVALAGGALVALGLWLAPLSPGATMAAAAAMLWVMVRSCLKLGQERMRAAGEVRRYALIDILQAGGGFLLAALFAALGLGAAAPFAGAALATATCLAVISAAELGGARGGQFDAQRLRGYARYGIPLSLSLVLGLALTTTDRFILAAVSGDTAVAAYHAGAMLAGRVLDLIFLWLTMAGGPAMVHALERGGEAALHKPARDQVSMMLAIAIPAAVGIALVATPLTHLMVGADISGDAAHVTPWIAIGALLAGVTGHYLNHAFTLSRRTGLHLLAVAVPAVVHLALCLALIPAYGARGAAWATAGAYGVGVIASYLLMRRCIRLPIPWRTIAGASAATAMMAAVVSLLPASGGIAELTVKAATGALVYALAAILLDVGGARHAARMMLALLPGLKASRA